MLGLKNFKLNFIEKYYFPYKARVSKLALTYICLCYDGVHYTYVM